MSGNDQEEPYELYDQYHGCHYVQDEQTLVLADRLGSGSFRMVLLDADSAASVAKGKFRLVYQHRDMDGYIELPAVISEDDVPDDIAKSVLRMEDRVGALGVYTPDKVDAKRIMSSANRPPVETQALPPKMAPAIMAMKGTLAPQGMKVVVMMVMRRSRSFSMVREAITPGMPQPVPMRMGMKLLPDRPKRRNTRSSTKAIRAM